MVIIIVKINYRDINIWISLYYEL